MYNIYAYIHIYIIFVGFDMKWNKKGIPVIVLNQFKSFWLLKWWKANWKQGIQQDKRVQFQMINNSIKINLYIKILLGCWFPKGRSMKANNEMDYGLKEMNEMVYGLEKLKWNVIIDVDKVNRKEWRLSDYVMMRCKLITEHLSLLLII